MTKRGIAITPVKFGISFTATLFNQAGALVHVYTDGSIQVNHGGTEMGQGLNTKVAQIVADELGVPFERVLCTASDTSKNPNASATAASAGTDLNGRAAQFAARRVRDNLSAFVCGLDGCGAGAIRFEGGQVHSPNATRNFDEVVKLAYANRIQLWSDGFYRTPKIHYDKTTLTGRPFYFPTAGDVPEHFKVDLWPEPNREENVFGSKAVGEPPLMLAISVYEALRDAVAQARGDGQVVQLTAPATAEHVLRALAIWGD